MVKKAASKKTALKPIESMTSAKKLNSMRNTVTLLAALLISVIGLRYIAQDLLAPILMATFFAALIYPFFSRLRLKGYRSGSAMALVMVAALASLIGIAIFVTWSFQLVSAAISPIFLQFQENFSRLLTSWGIETSYASTIASELSPNQLLNVVTSIFGQFGTFVMYFLLVPIMAILLVLQAGTIPPDLMEQLSTENSVMLRVKKFASSISLYISNRFKVNSITGLGLFIFLTIVGIPFAFIWGVLALIMSFIPYIGLSIASIPPIILALMAGGVPLALIVLAGIILINFAIENVIDPMIQGASNKISTAAVVIAFIFWTWLLGPVGAILSTPLTVLLKIILADYQETHWIALLMEGNYSQTKQELQRSDNSHGWWRQLSVKQWLK